MNKSFSKFKIRLICCLTIALGLGLIKFGSTPSTYPIPSKLPDGEQVHLVKVTRVIDGDTIEINDQGKVSKVRYIGVDAPETVDPHRPVGCYGHEASQEDHNLVDGKTVAISRDVEDTDKFGRLLRYVYLPVDSQNWLFVNDYLVRQGFARSDPIAPDLTLQTEFAEAALEAQNNQRGLWSKCATK